MSFKTPRLAAAALAATAMLAASAATAHAYGDDTAPSLDVDGMTYVMGDGPTVLRIAGEDRIATAIKAFCAVPKWRFNDPKRSDALVLASSENFADALASADRSYVGISVSPTPDQGSRCRAGPSHTARATRAKTVGRIQSGRTSGRARARRSGEAVIDASAGARRTRGGFAPRRRLAQSWCWWP